MSFQCTEAFVTLATNNFEELVNFYIHFLSQNPSNHIKNVYAEFQISGLKLGIFKLMFRSQRLGKSDVSS